MNEMYAADVKNWLMKIADGVKAMRRQIKYADCPKGGEWRVTTECYDKFSKGVAIHRVKQIADVIDVPVKYFYVEDSSIVSCYCYFEMFGVRFYDLVTKEEVPDEWK